jgi:hypothetical protein
MATAAGIIPVCFSCISLTVATLLLLIITVIQLRGYGWPCVTTGLGYAMKMSSFCSIVTGCIPPDGLLNGYDAMAWMLWTTLHTLAVLQPAFSICGPL